MSSGSSPASTAELGEHPITAVGVTPGWLRSEKMLENFGVTEANWRDACVEASRLRDLGVAHLCRQGRCGPRPSRRQSRWAGTIVSARQLADAYDFTDTDGSRPDCWGHIATYGWEHQDGRGIDDFR